MYRVYVVKQRTGGSEVLAHTKTSSPSHAAAKAAFWDLYEEPFGSDHLLLMSRDRQQINAYRYQSNPGDRDYIAPGSDLVD